MPDMIRGPTHGDAGCPDGSVGWIVLPAAVFIEVRIARHVARYVSRRHSAVLARVALFGPQVEGVGTLDISHVGDDRIDAVKLAALARIEAITSLRS